MNLFIFPEGANYSNGYSIAVDYAFKRLSPGKEDVVVWYTDQDKEKLFYVKDDDFFINRNKTLSFRTAVNLFSGKPRTELYSKDLFFLKQYDFDLIHCDEVLFYRALRKLFPNKRINLRLHNCYSRIKTRREMLGINVDWVFKYNLRVVTNLEKEIFNDNNVYKIFISDEDRFYYTSMFGRLSDSETWAFLPDKNLAIKNREDEGFKYNHKLIWYGGCESHKQKSVRWFIDNVFKSLWNDNKDLEFHLWGSKTEQFNNPSNNIFGHGYYHGSGLPEKQSLYVNPDIIGGGIKLKIKSLYEAGVHVLTTPFGFEGYKDDIVDDYLIVAESQDWITEIRRLLELNH